MDLNHPTPERLLDWYTLPPGDGWIGTPCLLVMVGFETPYPGLDWNTLPLAMVGFETPYPGAVVGLVHPAPGNGWI